MQYKIIIIKMVLLNKNVCKLFEIKTGVKHIFFNCILQKTITDWIVSLPQETVLELATGKINDIKCLAFADDLPFCQEQ